MNITLNTTRQLDDRTLGELKCGELTLFTLEDKVREIPGQDPYEWKVPHETAIPAGRYRVVLDFSHRFGREMPHLLDVPGFEGIRIHSGNRPEDTEGCILVGLNVVGTAQPVLANSRTAFTALMEQLEAAYDRKEEIWIDVNRLPTEIV